MVDILLLAEWLRNTLEILMFSEANKVFQDNPNFVPSLLYFLPTPHLF